MGWISVEDRMPPQGLSVLVEASGYFTECGYSMLADHDFFLGSWIVPTHKTEGEWLLYSNCGKFEGWLTDPEVHAWMPLPKHYGQQTTFGTEDDDGYEHPMFEDEPEWLYKGDCVYEQMTLEEFLGGAK